MKFKDKQHEVNYKRKMSKIRKVKAYYEKLKVGAAVNKNEKISNLNKMLARGQITKEEFDTKLSTLT